MNSMEALAKGTRFAGFGAASVVGLVIAGYLALAGSTLLVFNNRPDPTSGSVEHTVQSAPVLVCECHPQAPRTCAAN